MNVLLMYQKRDDWLRELNKETDEVYKDKSRFLQRDFEINKIIDNLDLTDFKIIHLTNQNDFRNLNLQTLDSNNTIGWNITDGYDIYLGAHLPSFLHLLSIPHIMENTFIQALAQNKDYLKKVVQIFGVLTPESITVTPEDNLNELKLFFEGPYFIKPSRLDNSIALLPNGESVCFDKIEAINKALNQAKIYNTPMLIEKFIDGTDHTSPYAIIDNRTYLAAFTEVIEDEIEKKINYQSKKTKDLRLKHIELTKEPDKTKIFKIATCLINKLNLSSYGRFDFRKDKKTGEIYLLEFNPGSSLTCLSFEKFCEQNNWTLQDFLTKMIISTQKRFKNEKKNNNN